MRAKGKFGRAAFGAAVVVAFLFAQPVAANAAPTPEPVAEAEFEVETHCFSDVVTGVSECAPTQRELADELLIEHGVEIAGTDVPARLKPSKAAKAEVERRHNDASRVDGAPLTDVTIQATYILGTIYSDPSYTGSSHTHSANLTSAPCAQAGSYSYGAFSNMSFAWPTLWNDKVSSYQGYGNCGFRLFADAGFQGSIYGPKKLAPTLGPMNNQTSSMDTQKV